MEEMTATTRSRSTVPKSVKLAAVYLVLAGTIGIVFQLLDLGPSHPEFTAKSQSFRLGAHTREIAISVLFLSAGTGLFLSRPWARMLSLVTLVIASIYSAFSFACVFARHRPSIGILAVSFLIVGSWNSIWFIIIYKNALKGAPNQAL